MWLWRVHGVDYYAGVEVAEPDAGQRTGPRPTLRCTRPEEGEQVCPMCFKAAEMVSWGPGVQHCRGGQGRGAYSHRALCLVCIVASFGRMMLIVNVCSSIVVRMWRVIPARSLVLCGDKQLLKLRCTFGSA